MILKSKYSKDEQDKQQTLPMSLPSRSFPQLTCYVSRNLIGPKGNEDCSVEVSFSHDIFIVKRELEHYINRGIKNEKTGHFWIAEKELPVLKEIIVDVWKYELVGY